MCLDCSFAHIPSSSFIRFVIRGFITGLMMLSLVCVGLLTQHHQADPARGDSSTDSVCTE